MSLITIHCQLFAEEAARKYLWQLMTEQNTPLVNELLRLVAFHPDFLTWRKKGNLPTVEVIKFSKMLRDDSSFSNQPSSFRISAEKTVIYTFKSWLEIQKRTQRQLDGKSSWLRMLRTDEELMSDCGKELEKIRKKAQAIFLKYRQSDDSDSSKKAFRNNLYQAYDKAKDALTRCSIAYLLKNQCQIPEDGEEDLKKFLKYRCKIDIQVKRLTQQLENRLPHGRDITGEGFLITLALAAGSVPADENEASIWRSQLMKKADLVPFPVTFESNMDLMWFSSQPSKIGLHIGGISEYEFTIGCGQRQLPYFQRFLTDYQTMLASKRQHTSSLFTLRSAKLVWKPRKGKGNPWDVHQLYLFCTLDTRLLTAEGTESVKKQVAAGTKRKIQIMQDKPDLTDTQNNYVKRLESTIERLDGHFDRPSKPLYEGQSNIIVAVSMGLKSPITAAVIDVMSQKAITYRSTKQLLGDNYRLLNRQRNLQTQQRHQSHKNQKQGRIRQGTNSDLGEYLDRLLAKAIVDLAQTYGAGSVALPKIEQIRLSIQSEVDAMAQQKIPDYVEGQKKYAKQVRINLHNWSYNRLSETIINKAKLSQLIIEYGDQPARLNTTEQAREVALSAYLKRKN
jgi:hypothetical protein